MLKRKAYDKLLAWKHNTHRKTAMLIEGARRVGKSTLAETFGKNEYSSYLVIDFFQAPTEVKNYFEDYRTDFDTLFLYLQAFYGVTLVKGDSLVVFDEVQMFPQARGLIKYLVADGRYDYIETGSLLSIKQNIDKIVLPSEEETLALEPLDFEEFLWGMGEENLSTLIRQQFAELKPLPEGLHRRASGLLREYMLVGGMPKVVATYIEERNFSVVDQEKRQILTLYRNDVARFAGGYEFKVVSVLDNIPGQLSKREKKFTLASLDKNARMRDYEEAFFWLADARISNICYASTDPIVGLSLNKEYRSLKSYMSDTGLLVTLAFADKNITDESVYHSVLRGNIGINEGMLVENLVAQMLVATGHKLFFYSQSGHKEGEERMEIDFLITRPYADAAGKPRISPIEVKSPRQYGTTSLDRFKNKFGKRIGTQYVLHPKQMKVENDRVYLPLYMGWCL
ncbi:MAG TPA: ATP-binding protein [Clostridiaceae bacterium]|nr:ATP-binding protein [Clostridiaceae bacterium]